ncbi:MAG: PcfJ domain-containing protein [Oscillospiraceae bacterium]|nr:PcfJ domain-containing protein [Oscillospiraceae bacterium]
MEELEFTLKPVKGLEEWIKKQYETHYIWYRRKGYYAECACSECGQKYILRTVSTGDPFEDDAVDIEKPERDKETKCRRCGIKAAYKPAGHTKSEYHYKYFVSGQKITDDKFAFRIYVTRQVIHANLQTGYRCDDYKLIVCEKGKKPVRYDHVYDGWIKGSCGEQFRYMAHPSLFREIKKTGMYKYIPVPDWAMSHYYDDSWILDFYIAAARYPDFEMLIKLKLNDLWQRLMEKLPTNINPRGKTIEDRLRIYKSRLKELVEAKGQHELLFLFQLEKKLNAHWTDEEIEIVNILRERNYYKKYELILKYATPTRIKNYMIKQKMWPKKGESYQKSREKEQARNTYYDYIQMRIDQGYEMNDIQLFPKDMRRRHDEMVLEAEKTKLDKRKKEANERYSKIKAKYRRLSDKYSAAAGGLIIRPAKDAAEIVTEGRILHHCVGGDNYLSSHNDGRSFILFLRKINDKDMPYITVEIRDDKIVQWYGAYDRKPDAALIEAWLEKYIKELKKHEKMLKKGKKSSKTKQNDQKTA